MILETKVFHEIFEEFVYLDENFYNNLVWKSNSIIKLMNISQEIEDKQIIIEGLKMILNLCKFRECGELTDPYESESYPVNELTGSDKFLLNSILKAEFT